MFKREAVFGSLSDQEITASLNACGLIDKPQYTVEEKGLFDTCRSLIEAGKTYEEVQGTFDLEGYRQQSAVEQQALSSEPATAKVEKATKKNKKADKPPTVHLADLLSFGRVETGHQLSLSDVAKLLELCGLPEKEEYTISERDRFSEACRTLKTMTTQKPQTFEIEQRIAEVAIASEEGLIRLVDKVTDKQALNISGLVNALYLQKVSHKLAQTPEEIGIFYAQLEQRILDQIEGKSRLPSLMGVSGQTISLPHSSDTPTQLPSASETTINENSTLTNEQ
jgi:hypothetical protein